MLEIILAGVLYISVLICAGTKMVKDHSKTCTKARASELIESSSYFNEEIGASMKALEQELGVILPVEIEKVELLAGPKR